MRFLLTIFIFTCSIFASGLPDEYYQISDHQVKKEEFIKFILPIVEEKNREIIEEREFVEAYFSDELLIRFNEDFNKVNLQKLITIAKKYNISNLYDKEEYLKKIDAIPLSMALSQAALESGWGKSLYAKKYNNLFGHYTFTKGVESKYVSGKRERIRVFPDISTSIESYMRNLNTHWAYENFRKARLQARNTNDYFSGIAAVKYITKYSEIGKRYIAMLKTIIKENNLLIYDKFYVTKKSKDFLLHNVTISSL